MYSERNGPSAGLRPLIRTPTGTGACSDRGPLRSTSLQGRHRHCQHGDAGARRWRPGARNYGAILSAFKTPVHLMRQDSLMLDGRPTFAVGYDRSFSSTEDVDDFLAKRGTRSGRNGLSVFVVLTRRRRLQAQTGLASGRSSKVTTAAFRSRWCRLAATIRPIISCRKCGGYDADRRKQFYVRDRERFVSDDPRRAIHHQRRLRDRA